MMSYDGTISAMSTLAHELGHSMHSYLTCKHQPMIYGDCSMFAAEVASNFNQAMVRDHLLSTEDVILPRKNGHPQAAIVDMCCSNWSGDT